MILKLAFLVFFMLATFSSVRPDSLLDTMQMYWLASPQVIDARPCEPREETEDYEEAEVYHWELGTPDNVEKTEVIVDPYSD